MSYEFGHTAVMVTEPGPEMDATWRPPGWELIEQRLAESAEARVSVCRVIREVSAVEMQKAEVGLECERAEAVRRGIRGVGPAIDAVAELWDRWRWLSLTSQGVEIASSSGLLEMTFEEKRFVKDLLDLQVLLLRAKKEDQRLSSLAGISGMDGCQMGVFRESCWHLAAVRFLVSAHDGILRAARTRVAIQPGGVVKRRPQSGRDVPREWEDLWEDDQGILREISKGEAMRKSMARASRRSVSHVDARLAELRRWGLVRKESRPYALTEAGEEWVNTGA